MPLAQTEALRQAAAQFRFYEAEHRKKETTDGLVKAETNARFAMMCERAAEPWSTDLTAAPSGCRVLAARETDEGEWLVGVFYTPIPTSCTHWRPLPELPA